MTDQRKSAVVTGASGDLGVAICERLVRAGFDVFAQFHTREERLLALADSLGCAGRSLRPVCADLTREDEVQHLFGAVREHTSSLELLVNNAGGARPSLLQELTLDDWNSCFALNVTAMFLCTREGRPLLSAGAGLVLNMSSVAAFSGGAFGAHYAAAKAAVLGLTRSLARELGREGIRVNAVAPGPVVSAMTTSLAPDALASILATTALGRCIEADEIASMVVAWATGFSAVTGQTLVVDGGRIFH
ncbi:MAG: SDR family NAD(P)-dependent oxidoreductase [Acidobacteriota bacterium]